MDAVTCGYPTQLPDLMLTEKREKGDLRLDPAYGRRVSIRAGVGTFLLPSKGFFFASSPSPSTECLVGVLDWSHHPRWFPRLE
ncbi:unnamed protein product, partial [Brassica oleracea]